jgi:hypothetical protein
MVCEFPSGKKSVIECCQCNGFHATDISCLDAMRNEAHRLLREKSEDFERMSKKIDRLEDELLKAWKEQRIFDKALDLATATTTFRNWLLNRAKEELERE